MKTLSDLRDDWPNLVKDEFAVDPQVNRNSFVPSILDFGIGIEVEVENAGKVIPMSLNNLWISDKDNSLRNHGLELKTRPLGSKEAVGAALGVLKSFLSANAQLDFSWRTSVHVHADLSQFTLASICNLNLCYIAIEPLLFKTFASQRKDSIFCVPLYDANLESLNGIKTCWNALKAKKEIRWNETLGREWPVEQKYSALNYYRINEFGTVEFRHLSGTADVEFILRWIQALQYLLKFSHESKFSTLVKRICQINSDSQYHLLLKDIFGPMAPDFQFKGFEEYIAEGVRKAKFLLFYNNPQSKKLISQTGTNKTAESFLKKKKERFERDFPFDY